MSDVLQVKQKSKDIRNDEINENSTNSQINNKNRAIKKKNGAIIGLSIATGILALSTIGFGIGFGISQSNSMNYQNSLESVYKSNFYSMLDSINNLETKLSKTLASDSSTYQRKTLLEASKNASEAEISVSFLPLSQSDIQDTIKLTNQISGYTSTLADKIASGENLDEDDKATLEDIEQSIMQLKNQLNEYARKLNSGVSILESSMEIDSNSNEFSKALSLNGDNSIEYPTMIYDGPFSDSVVNTTVKGLKGNKITKTEAMQDVQKYFKEAVDVTYESETKGKFETYNFRVKNSDEEMLYVQVTQVEGHILTISGAGEEGEQSIDIEQARSIALDFAKENGVENAEIVWSDTIENDVYFNIAPLQSGIVLYPDLVKVKINLTSGTIVGYDATSYFTNHTTRQLEKGSLTLEEAKAKVGSDYTVKQSRLVLSPLDYNREVVCVEVETTKGENTYYFFYNASSGELENVLKVIETDNGNLLM